MPRHQARIDAVPTGALYRPVIDPRGVGSARLGVRKG